MSFTIQIFNTSALKAVPRAKITQTVERVLKGEKISEAEINIIIVSDEEIHEMNRNFLQHDYPTDVITFPLGDDPLEGEIYISADTAAAQSREYKASLTNELMRLAAHGALHLAGYNDATDAERHTMHLLENRYICSE
ncbi:MAG: rRNA maturation RNase YbeY [Bacteroidota bacterium]